MECFGVVRRPGFEPGIVGLDDLIIFVPGSRKPHKLGTLTILSSRINRGYIVRRNQLTVEV